MFAAAIPAVLAVLTQVAGLSGITAAPAIGAAVDAIVALAPTLIKTAPAMYDTVKDIITTLRGNDQVDPDMLKKLDLSEAQIDLDWEQAKVEAKAADDAAK